MTRSEHILEQVNFCGALMKALSRDVDKNVMSDKYINDSKCSLTGYTQLQNDIIKLRRELMELSRMVGGQF